MEAILNKFSDNQTSLEIKGLLMGIHNTTIQMNNTFQQAIIRHEEQFIKTYRTKIVELSKLFEELTKVIQDKFINNALTNRLQIVLKQRDYFKYQCLKLNMQYQTIQNQQNSMSSQITNVIEQMNIYKHLLEDEKLKNKNLQQNMNKIKTSFSSLAYKSLTETAENYENSNKYKEDTDYNKIKKKLQSVTNQLKEKQESVRHLKMKVNELENKIYETTSINIQYKQLYNVFKACVSAWKRDLLTKQRKKTMKEDRKICSATYSLGNTLSLQKISATNKKQLLRYLFTTSQFLDLIEKLLFSSEVEIEFIERSGENQQQNYLKKNRKKLFEYMRRKKIVNSPFFTQMR